MKNKVENIEQKVIQLISSYKLLSKEHEFILNQNDKLKSNLSEKELSINQLEEKIKLLRITKSVDNHDAKNNKESRHKINEYVREIDKCIALLNK